MGGKHMKKRMIGLLLVLCMVLSLMPVFSVPAEAAAGLTLQELKAKFPAGRYWNGNNPDGTTDRACTVRSNGSHPDVGDSDLGSSPGDNYWCGACQCYGFALKVAYDACGITSQSYWGDVGFKKLTGSSALDSLKPGDIIRVGGESYGHSVFVTAVDGDSFTYGDCNYIRGCGIRWDVSGTKTAVRNGTFHGYAFSYVLSAPTPLVVGNDPIIVLDSVDSPSAGKIHVRGWAFDPDNTSGTVPIHVYTTAAQVIGVVDANAYRPDVDNAYHCGAYHGFDAVFTTGLSGLLTVQAAAINVFGGGNNHWSDGREVTVAADTESPKITDVRISERSSTGYTVTCTVEDNVGIEKVEFPTWTISGDQDDLVWHVGTIDGNTASCRINVSDHNNEVNCTYITHIYAYDYAGNAAQFGTSARVDAMPPVISDIKIENVSDDGYDIVCNVADEDDAGLGRVLFPTWTSKDDQDDLDPAWAENPLYLGTIEGSTVRYRVNTSDHNGEKGYYFTHIYASDASGNSDWLAVDAYIGDIRERSEYIYQTGSFNGSQYIVFTNKSYWSAASTYCQSLGGHLATISSKAENDYVLSLLEPGAGPYWIGANDIAQEGEFVWANGEAFEYTNWRNGEPNNLDGRQDCGCITSDGTWDDENVNVPHPFVLEIEDPEPVANPFSDVPEGKFYTDAVLWAVNQDPQVTSGYADGTFRPDQTCTRAQVVTFLWRAKGCPEPTTTVNPFKDVSASAYYYKAVLWAVENNITTGYADGTFRPDGECTRGHVVTFLWRLEGSPAPQSTANPFKDVPAGKFYTSAALWAVENHITTGYSDGTFRPDGACTRGHVVTFLYRDLA